MDDYKCDRKFNFYIFMSVTMDVLDSAKDENGDFLSTLIRSIVRNLGDEVNQLQRELIEDGIRESEDDTIQDALRLFEGRQFLGFNGERIVIAIEIPDKFDLVVNIKKRWSNYVIGHHTNWSRKLNGESGNENSTSSTNIIESFVVCFNLWWLKWYVFGFSCRGDRFFFT